MWKLLLLSSVFLWYVMYFVFVLKRCNFFSWDLESIVCVFLGVFWVKVIKCWYFEFGGGIVCLNVIRVIVNIVDVMCFFL